MIPFSWIYSWVGGWSKGLEPLWNPHSCYDLKKMYSRRCASVSYVMILIKKLEVDLWFLLFLHFPASQVNHKTVFFAGNCMVFRTGGRHTCTLKSIMTCKDMFTLTLVLLEFCNLGQFSNIFFLKGKVKRFPIPSPPLRNRDRGPSEIGQSCCSAASWEFQLVGLSWWDFRFIPSTSRSPSRALCHESGTLAMLSLGSHL